MRPYLVLSPTPSSRSVEAWSSYQLQFEGQRRYSWQAEFATELGAALTALQLNPGEVLAGAYATTDPRRCDVENRLFTNPGTKVVGRPTAISFEHIRRMPPDPPLDVDFTNRHRHYYRYRVGGPWEWWEPSEQLVRWTRVPHVLPADGSARPAWLSMRLAAARGLVSTTRTPQAPLTAFGIRITIHPTRTGPRSAAAASEPLMDGVIAAFHGRERRPEVASIVAARIMPRAPRLTRSEVEQLATTDGPGPLFDVSPFTGTGGISPADELCDAGIVTLGPATSGRVPEISGELFTLRRVQ